MGYNAEKREIRSVLKSSRRSSRGVHDDECLSLVSLLLCIQKGKEQQQLKLKFHDMNIRRCINNDAMVWIMSSSCRKGTCIRGIQLGE